MHSLSKGFFWALTVGVSLICAAASADRLPGLPSSIKERNGPVSWYVDGSDTLTIDAAGKTNWFISPANLRSWDNAPTLLFRPDSDFILSAKISQYAKSRWDAGALVLFVDDATWAKFCLEAPNGPPQLQVVSVVTSDVSDDSYSVPVVGNVLYMQVSKRGRAFAFHISDDGKSWQLIRTFRLRGSEDVMVGFLAQSPSGDGLAAKFSEIHYQLIKSDP